MLKRLCVAVAAVLLSGAATTAHVLPAAAAPPTPYYLSLGDSLAQGVQPNAAGVSVETAQGYADDLYAASRHRFPNLQLAKLGCPGETTGTMVHGGVCAYPHWTQLAEAVEFLRTHRVVLVTLDIGANNIDGCIGGGVVDPACIADGIAAAAADVPAILAALRSAAGPGVRIAGMNYYDPFLAAWLQGPAGQALATESVSVAVEFNRVLDAAYQAFGVPIADVAAAFHITDFTPVPWRGAVPLNVALVCAWTWMCAPPPVGPNIHANSVGYAIIALAFAQQIR